MKIKIKDYLRAVYMVFSQIPQLFRVMGSKTSYTLSDGWGAVHLSYMISLSILSDYKFKRILDIGCGQWGFHPSAKEKPQ